MGSLQQNGLSQPLNHGVETVAARVAGRTDVSGLRPMIKGTETVGLARDNLAYVAPSGVPATRTLNVPVSKVNIDEAVATILDWAASGTAHFICVRDVHGIMRAQEDPELMRIHDRAGMVTPDGMPLVWIIRQRGNRQVGRVCGADLVEALCRASPAAGVRHYFYGGKDGVAQRMVDQIRQMVPDLTVAGYGTPPFGKLTAEEDEAETRRIADAQPHVVWVGLSTPKQEYWMAEHVGRIPGATLIGVGAAFDFYAGDVQRAPRWMRKSGFEWLHRLMSEPRRLWRRYLVLAPKFVGLVLLTAWVPGRRRA